MPTTNPVPSTDPSDLLFNAGKLDEVVNGIANSFTDRLGIARRTVAGMNADFDAQLADAESDLNVYRADAAASAAEALGYLQTIRATSYGAYASDPATDPLGNPPTEGDEYWNTTAKLLKRWNGMTWQASDINTANLAAPSGSSLVGYDGGTVQDVLDGAKSLQDYAALRAYAGRAKRVYITGLLATAKPSGIAGPFQYDPTDTTSLDNGGTIIVGADGRRWKRDYIGAVNICWFGAVGDWDSVGTDNTLAVKSAVDFVKALPGGGTVYAPRGNYGLTEIDLSNTTSDYTRTLRLVGDGEFATKFTINGSGVGIDCIGRPQVKLENFMVTSGSTSPSVGILFARSATAGSIMFSTMRNVRVEGNFSQACVASVACESFAVFDSHVNNTNPAGGVGWYTGLSPTGRKQDGTGAYVEFTVSSTKGVIQASANTSIAFYRTNMLCYGNNGTPLSIDSGVNASFFGCELIPTTSGAKQCVLISDVYSTPFNGPLNFNGCLFESQYAHGILFHSKRANPSFDKINVTDNNFVFFGTGQESVTYANEHTGDIVLVALKYAGNTRPGTQNDSINVQYLSRCDIDIPRGTFKLYSAALNSRLRGTREFTRSAELITWLSNEYERPSATSKPASGIFIKGERVYNSAPASGGYIGWTASAENGAAWTSTRANSTNYAVGIWIKDGVTSGNPVYEVTATSGSGLTGTSTPVKPASIGSTVVDGDLTLTLRANRATTMLSFGAIV